MTTQPKTLPAVLPTGTRTAYGDVAADELRLGASGNMYSGLFTHYPHPMAYHAVSIDWSSVRLPEPAEAPKLCAACATEAGSGCFFDGKKSQPLCFGCYRRTYNEVERDIARRAAQAAPDRPIQAGDWVECVDASGREQLTVGELYQVERVRESSDPRRPQFDLLGVDSPAFGLCASRFKTSGGVCVEQSAAPAVPDTGLLRDEFCPECATPLTHETTGKAPLCVECTARRENQWAPCRACGKSVHPGASEPGGVCGACAVKVPCFECKVPVAELIKRRCVYCAQREHERTRTGMPGNPVENEAARAALADAERAEGPKIRNPSDRRECARAHPWEEFDDLESR